MKVVIGTSTYCREQGYRTAIPNAVIYPPHAMYPQDIRTGIEEMFLAEQDSGVEVTLVTLDRTVLEYVSNHPKGYASIPYENVSICITGNVLVPLLSLETEAYLSHFDFGDLFSRMDSMWVTGQGHQKVSQSESRI